MRTPRKREAVSVHARGLQICRVCAAAGGELAMLDDAPRQSWTPLPEGPGRLEAAAAAHASVHNRQSALQASQPCGSLGSLAQL